MRQKLTAAAIFSLLASISASANELEPARLMTAYQGGGCVGAERLIEFESFIGQKVTLATDGLDSRSWKTIHDSVAWGSNCWRKAGKKLSLGVPMLPRDGSTTLAEAAAGAHDDVFDYVARTLIATGNADAIIRIGWEFNGNWFPWAASRDPENYVALWRRIVAIFRAAPGEKFRFDWCPGAGANQIAPDRVYPGDDVVDIIGLDVYNAIWNSTPRDPQARWSGYETGAYGLRWQRDFARAHGKLISFPEWGTGDRPDGHGAGDDPVFIRRMAEWIRSNPVEYHSYWDYRASDYDAKISDGRRPLAAAAFKGEFGRTK